MFHILKCEYFLVAAHLLCIYCTQMRASEFHFYVYHYQN